MNRKLCLMKLAAYQKSAYDSFPQADASDHAKRHERHWKKARAQALSTLSKWIGAKPAKKEVDQAESERLFLEEVAPTPWRRPWEYWTLVMREARIHHAAQSSPQRSRIEAYRLPHA